MLEDHSQAPPLTNCTRCPQEMLFVLVSAWARNGGGFHGPACLWLPSMLYTYRRNLMKIEAETIMHTKSTRIDLDKTFMTFNDLCGN